MNLVNLNSTMPNFPAIDLGDKTARIAFQVTRDGKATKIQKTIDSFVKHKLVLDYDRLRFMVFGRKQNSYSTLKVDPSVGFDWKSDILDVSDLHRQLNKLGTQQLQSIALIVEQELSFGAAIGATSKHDDKMALDYFRRHFDRPWMHDDWRNERNFSDFEARAKEAIRLLNSGVIDANAITKSRHDFSDPALADGLEDAYHKLRKLLEEFSKRSRINDPNREIDLPSNTCRFKCDATIDLFNALRQEITETLNPLLKQVGLKGLIGVLQ
jgi:hypothetical protein